LTRQGLCKRSPKLCEKQTKPSWSRDSRVVIKKRIRREKASARFMFSNEKRGGDLFAGKWENREAGGKGGGCDAVQLKVRN